MYVSHYITFVHSRVRVCETILDFRVKVQKKKKLAAIIYIEIYTLTSIPHLSTGYRLKRARSVYV